MVRDCPHCATAKASFQIPWSAHLKGVSGPNFIGIGVCGACGNPAAFSAQNRNNHTPPSGYVANVEDAGYSITGFWPVPAKPDIPRHLPEDYAKKLLEAERSYAAGIPTGAAGLYRSLIDITTKRQLNGAEQKTAGTLMARIDRLAEKLVIPKAVAEWAHEVRVIANDGLHEEMVVTQDDATMARNFAQTYLRYVFELPGDVAMRHAPKAGS